MYWVQNLYTLELTGNQLKLIFNLNKLSKMGQIKITGSNSVTGVLTLDDHGLTHAGRGEQITWRLERNCGVASIEEISVKPSPPGPPSTNIWSTMPRRDGGSTNWKGAISASAAGGAEWNYLIKWIADDGSGEHTFDPKIIVNTFI